VLARSPSPQHFNWEDCDLLKTAGRQAASHLAQLEAARALADARQFETCNRPVDLCDARPEESRRAAVAGVTNAAKHKHNPQFMEDAIRTVEHSVDKMNRLMAHLRSVVPITGRSLRWNSANCCTMWHGPWPVDGPHPVWIVRPKGIAARANKDRFAAIIGHLVRNAQDATPDDGRIIMRLFKLDEWAVIEVQDNGSGMDAQFIRDRLFRPFETTKGKAGMGIGVYETREFVHALGGMSRSSAGWMKARLSAYECPLAMKTKIPYVMLNRGERYPNDGKYKEIAGR